MTETRDSMDGLIAAIDVQIAAGKRSEDHPIDGFWQAYLSTVRDELRALRERQEKAWGKVEAVEVALGREEKAARGGQISVSRSGSYADALRSAREEAS